MKKKFLFISYGGLINDLAWKVYQEKNSVKCYIAAKEYKNSGDGFVPKTDNWQKYLDWADVIVLEQNVSLIDGVKVAALRKYDKKIIGHSFYTDRLECDRSFGQEQLKLAGVKILDYQEFTHFNKAIRYIKNNPQAYVLKMSGEAAAEHSFLYVGNLKNGQDVIDKLLSYKKFHRRLITSFILQKRVAGVEVAIGAFFNGNKFIQPINFNFEHKRLFPGDLGPLTCEMGTSMFWSKPNRLFNETLGKMESFFAKSKYVGYIDINCLVDHKGIYPLEFTSRFGYPTIYIQQEGIKTPMGQLLVNLVEHKDFTIELKAKHQVGVKVAMPPFPYFSQRDFNTLSKNARVVIKQNNLAGIHIEDVMKINNQWQIVGAGGHALVVAGCGQTMLKAQKQAYQRLRSVSIPNMYYRNDIGDKWTGESKLLKKWGYI